MEEQFVSYEIANKLKELGFNVPTMAFYDEAGRFVFVPYNEHNINEGTLIEDQSSDVNPGTMKMCATFDCAAPLWQQAIDWLREKHTCHILIRMDDGDYYFETHYGGEFQASCKPTFEETREASILIALESIR